MLPSSEIWLSSKHFAELVDISRRKATQALCRAIGGRPWRGTNLRVRVVTGRGGKSSECYEVALSSLSVELQSRFWGLSEARPDTCAILAHVSPGAASHTRSNIERVSTEAGATMLVQPLNEHPGRVGEVAPDQSERIEYRWRVIQEALAEPKRSTARRVEIERASRKWSVPVRTVERWIADLEASGGDVNALGRKKPEGAGVRRVHVSRRFDKGFVAAGNAPETLPELGERIDQLLRAAWASKTQRAGWKQVRREVATAFVRELRERGLAVPAYRADALISQRRVMEAQPYRIVDIYANDRKRFDDMKPRIRRDNSRFGPMEQVVMDVKPLDCTVRRADGTTTWPKMIGFMDTGTHRIFRHFVLLDKGEGVRQEHVADAFIRMVMDPEWGFPLQLYRDNGMEFAVLDMVRSALAMLNEPGARTIISAKPYSGASKPIESKFAVLDTFVFSQMGGYAGGNRMNKKTQTVGKPPAPYPGSFEEFVDEANERIAIFEHQEIGSGPFKGQSPQGCYAAHVANGWRPVMVDPLALDAAFCKRSTGRVDRGAVRFASNLWRHPELPNGQKITLALPWRRGAAPLAQLPGIGWVALQPDLPYLPGEIDGAIESARMQKRNEQRVRAMRKAAGTIDLEQNRRDNVMAFPKRVAPAPIMDALASQQALEMAAARRAGDEAVAALPSEAERRRARRMRVTEMLEAERAKKKR